MRINYFNKLKINENSSLSTLDFNIVSLSKHFKDLHNFLFLLKHSFDIICITEHKINKKLNIDFNLPGYVFWYNKTESSHRKIDFFVSNN